MNGNVYIQIGYIVEFIDNLLVNKMWTIYVKTMSGKDFDGDSCYAIF